MSTRLRSADLAPRCEDDAALMISDDARRLAEPSLVKRRLEVENL
jgi:hypothetical protein